MSNARIFNRHVLEQDISDGTVFYIYDSLEPLVLKRIADKIAEIAARSDKRIRIVTWGQATEYFTQQRHWLTPPIRLRADGDRYSLTLFQSKPGAEAELSPMAVQVLAEMGSGGNDDANVALDELLEDD